MRRPKAPRDIDSLHNACGLVAMCALGLWADGYGWHQKNGISLTRLILNIKRQNKVSNVTFMGKHPTVKQFAQLPLRGRFLVHTRRHVGVLWTGKVYNLGGKEKVLEAWKISGRTRR